MRGRCGDELCLATPEAYFAGGISDDVLLGNKQSLETELAAKRGTEIVHSCVGHPWFAKRVWVK